MRVFDRSGQVFSEWTLLKKIPGLSGPVYLCRCSCGTEKEIHMPNLSSGKTKSCGCKKGDFVRIARTKHGKSAHNGKRSSRAYSIWGSMLTRCTNKNCKSYANYGGRGISVCDRWKVFTNFLEDMGEPENGMSIDRIDPNGNYCKDNCRWATCKDQSRNRRSSVFTEEDINEIRLTGMTATEVMKKYNCKKSTAHAVVSGQNWSQS